MKRLFRITSSLVAISVMVALNLSAIVGAQNARILLAKGENEGGITAPGKPPTSQDIFIPVPQPYGVEVMWPVATGEILSLKDVKAQPGSATPKLTAEESEKLPKIPQAFAAEAPDTAIQNIFGPMAPMPNPIANFDGLGLTDQLSNFSPPDTNGDIGYDPATGKRYYFQWINVTYKAWDVTNPAAPVVVVPTTQGDALWDAALPGSTCANTNDGDPIALFDEQAQRWFISQFSISDPYHQCIAVSKTADPAGGWYAYDYVYRDGATYFNDYPHFGVWPDPVYNSYFMTVHQFNAAGTAWLGQAVVAFDRAKLLNGNAAAGVLFDLFSVNANFGGQLPADLDGPRPPAGTPGFFFEVDDSSFLPPNDAIRIWEFRPNWTTPASSTFGINGQPNYTVTVTGFNYLDCGGGSHTCVTQPGTTQQLDSLADRLMHRVAFRYLGSGATTTQTVVLNHTVEVGTNVSAPRWYQLQRNPTTGVWSVLQQSTYAPDTTLHRWMGSIATDRAGNIALGFSASNGSNLPSIRYAGRLVTDTVSTLPQTEVTAVTSTGSQTGSNRWGDYSMMGVDPQDGCTFWFTTEYNGATGLNWRTRIHSFKFPACTPISTGGLTGTVTNVNTSAPISGATVSLVDAASNTWSATSNASGVYRFIGIPATTYTVTGSATGYYNNTFTNVSVTTGATTTRNIPLTPLPQADLAITKTASGSSVGVSQPLAYTLATSNLGPDAITSTVTVTDVLPAGVTFGSASGTGWSCTGTSTVVCTRPSLAVGAAPNIVINVTAPSSPGTITNTASIGSAAADFTTSNNTSAIGIAVVPLTDLAITKTGPVTALVNSTLVYTLNVTNNGPLNIGVPVTQTYSNANTITFNDNTIASPYPSTINVSGMPPLTKVTMRLLGLTHSFPSDMDVLLVSPSGAKSLVLSDPAGGNDMTNVNLAFDDTAAAMSCVAASPSGIYSPTDCTDTLGDDALPAPAPSEPYAASFGQFNNTYADGVWRLYARDDYNLDTGSITAGWVLTLTGIYSGPVTVTDTLPAGTTYVNATGNGWSCSQSLGVVTCTRATLATGAAPNILITTTAPSTAGVITNTANVSSLWGDGTPANNNASASTTIIGLSANLGVVKTDSPDPVQVGSMLTYTITTTNAGPNAANPVLVTDTLPSGVVFNNASPGCVFGSGQVMCNLGNLNSGGSSVVTITVTPNSAGVITNTVVVGSNLTDPNLSNNTSTITTTVNAPLSANLGVVKTDTPDPVTVGSTLTYIITTTNGGPNTANAVVLSDTLPGGVAFASASAGCAFGGGVVTCNLGNLTNGSSAVITIAVTPNAAGNIINTVVVGSSTSDPVAGNNTDSETTTVNSALSADLNVIKTDVPDPVLVGSPLTYVITVTNGGPATANTVVATDTLPGGVTFASASGGCVFGGGQVTCNLGNLVNGAVVTRTIVVTPNSAGAITNTVVVASSTTDPNAANNSASASTTVGTAANADLSVVKTDSPDPVNVNALLTYFISVTNNGPSTAIGVVLTDSLPAGVTFSGASGGCSFGGGNVVCSLGNLASNSSASVNISVFPTISGTITNTVVVNSSTADANLTNNSAAALTFVRQYGVTLTPPTVAQSGNPGATVTYTLRVTNTGNVADVFDVLLNGNAFATSAPPTVGPLAPGAGTTFNVVVTIPGGAAGGTTDSVNVTARSQADNTKQSSATLQTTVNNVRGLLLTPASAAQSGNPGAVVLYTLQVTNTGNATDSFTVTLSGNAFPTSAPTVVGPLASGGSASFNITVTIPGGAAAGAVDAVNVNVRSQGDVTKQANSTLTTSVNLVRGLTLTPPTANQSGNPGTTVTYTLRLTNTGNASDTFTITLSGNAFTTNAPATVGPLAAGAAANFNVVVTIPGGAAAGATDMVNVTARSQGDPTKQAAAALTTQVNTVRGLSLTPLAAGQSGNPGQVLTYTLRVTNTGNGGDTFDIDLSGNAFPTTSSATFVSLLAGESTTFNVVVTIPVNALAGATDVVNVNVQSQGDPSKQANATLTTSVNLVRGLALSPATDGQPGQPGTTVTYTLQLTNTGNATDTFTVTLSGNVFATNAPATVGPLAAGATTSFNVVVTIPGGATMGTIDTVNVNVRSQGAPAQQANATLATTVNIAVGVMLSPASAEQNGDPGQTVTYTLQITNTGNASDTFTVTLSGNLFSTNTPATIGPLAPGASTSFNVVVTIPSGAAAGATDTVNVTVISQASPAQQANASLTTSVNTVYSVTISPSTANQSAYIGRVVTYTLLLTNTGNVADAYTLNVADNFFDVVLPSAVGPLAPGASAIITVVVTVPTNASDGQVDMASITATSQNDGTVFAASHLFTKALWYHQYLPYVTKP